MFYLGNVSSWLTEVVRACNQNRLDPLTSTFVLVLFSSLDFEFVNFFGHRRDQISSYSGENFHIFTPIVYENNVIPDGEWRILRHDFENVGIPVGNRPCLLFFRLIEKPNERKFEPKFFAGYRIDDFKIFECNLRDIIDRSLSQPKPEDQLALDIEILLRSPNIIHRAITIDTTLSKGVSDNLSLPKVFISYSSHDKPFVKKLYISLIRADIKVWIDEVQIKVGQNIQNVITEGIKESDYFILILSKNAVASDLVKFECAQFMVKMKPSHILPLLIGTSMKDLPSPFQNLSGFRYLDFSNKLNWDKNIEELCQTLRG